VAESFFQLLKRERIRRKTYTTREQARQDVFDYIEMFYAPQEVLLGITQNGVTATMIGFRR
ncbi:MAG: Integrase catalytic region, partial [Herminiimonas sp.]|nr:Integrase catalytic region [Herminiimonas sp.]